MSNFVMKTCVAESSVTNLDKKAEDVSTLPLNLTSLGAKGKALKTQ